MTGFRKAIERLAQGSSTLTLSTARGVVEWLKAGEKVSDFVIRLAFLGIPVAIVWSLLTASTASMWGFALLWCVAAWRAARPAQEKSESKDAGLHPDDLADLLWELAGDHKGVHLAQVAAQLTKETEGRSWSLKDVRKLLEAAGIPTRHSVRVPGLGVAVGVHRQDIPHPPEPLSGRRRAAGQPGYGYSYYAVRPEPRGRGHGHLHPRPPAAQPDARQRRPERE
ncbi:hypothetical protein ACFWP7_04925 [Streptomyces sp. NPDC058470]|uniref:hypothetical protein n=1 Tax=Streptomyces sp. NPDC058470 TaxID=3346515 RepID=UPI00366170EB